MMPRRFHSVVRLAAVLGLSATLRSEGPKTEPFEKDINFLANKVTQYSYRLKGGTEGERRLSTMETGLTRLRSILSQLKDLASEIESKESHLRYLKTMELEPKMREIERIRQTYDAERARFQREQDALNGEIRRHNDTPHQFTKEQSAALQAYNAEKYDLDARVADLDRRAQERGDELKQQFEAAVQAHAKIQQEFSETETKRDQAYQKFQGQASEYSGARESVVNELVALDQEPVQNTSVPLTAFPQGVRPEEAGTTPVVRPAIGPGNNTHAIDQLTVVVKSSRDAAGRNEKDEKVTTPAEVTAKIQSGYTFDTGGGTGMADLPGVETPEAKVQAVPLEVPATPIEEPAVPAPVKASPAVQEFARQQKEGLSKLDQLYQERKQLQQQGAQATSEDWTRVVNGISKAQADVIGAGVGLKLVEGSALLDLTVVPKAQKKLSDLTVPPPPSPTK